MTVSVRSKPPVDSGTVRGSAAVLHESAATWKGAPEAQAGARRGGALAARRLSFESDCRMRGLGYFETEVASGRVRWSERLYALLGMREGTVLIVPDVIELIHPDDVEPVLFITGDRTWRSCSYPFRLRHADGHYAPVICDSHREILRNRVVVEYGSVRLVDDPNVDFANLKEQKISLLDLAARQADLVGRLEQELAESRRVKQKLARLASIDALTGALNRRRFVERAEEEHARLARSAGAQSSVLVLDIDHFKSVNDRFGHAAGDSVLRQLIRRLRPHLRRHDCIGRLGGEEFAILSPDTGSEGAAVLAQRLVTTVREATWTWRKATIPLTVTVGVARIDPSRPLTETLMRADRALYRGKADGRDRAVVDPG